MIVGKIIKKNGEQLLRWLSPTTIPSQIAEEVATWDDSEWQNARWVIQVHGIGPLLYQQLRYTVVWGLLAPSLQTWLKQQYQLNGQRWQRLKSELECILFAAHQENILIAPLKGSVLAYHYYPDSVLRPMSDLDLLVRPQDEAALATILEHLQYRLIRSTPRHREYQSIHDNAPIYPFGEHPDNPRRVEVHTEVEERFWGIVYPLTNELWQGEIVHFGSAPALLSQNVPFMQHLLIHTTMDMIRGKMRGIQLLDIKQVGHHFCEHHWQHLVQAAQQTREERLFFGPLFFATRYLNDSPPAWVIEELAKGISFTLRHYLEQEATLFNLSFCNTYPIPLRQRLYWHRAGKERLMAIFYRFAPSLRELQQFYPSFGKPYFAPFAYMAHALNLSDNFCRRLLALPRPQRDRYK